VIRPPVLTKPVDLKDVIHPDVLWACTTCRACEEQCPVLISYVDKIVDMRRNLVMIKGEFRRSSPSRSRDGSERQPVEPVAHGSRELARARDSDHVRVSEAPVLFWVGCAASYDDRAKKIARATRS